jgi:hypothetical protein
MRNETADPSHFLEESSSDFPTHLAHAIAAQTPRNIKAMARAKFQHTSPISANSPFYI